MGPKVRILNLRLSIYKELNMEKQKRTDQQMQLEEASNRYNDDYAVYHQVPSPKSPLLNAYRKAVASFGLPLGKQSVQAAINRQLNQVCTLPTNGLLR
jgi:hypothetical protein